MVSEHVDSLQPIVWHEPRSSYDVVIVGGGGHGLATAYYLATRHGITNVAVVEAEYIASGNTGRNTTIIRANYAVPEAIRFYDHSMKLYQGLEAETGAAIFHREKGHVWLAHSEMGMRTERGRCLMNQAMGVRTEMLTPAEVRELVPQIDLTGGGRYPVFGASHHVEAATARHDRVAWTFASGATARGVHLIQHRPVTGLLRDGERVVGVRTAAGDIGAGIVLSAVGGRVTEMAAHAGVRLPIRTHPLHAFVTNDFEQGLDKIVASTELACYVSQTERGQMLIGAEFDSQPSYSRISSFDALRSYAYKITMLLPFLRPMRILRTWAGLCDISADWSPIMGETGVDGFLITTGWGTWGFKAIPAGGEALAERIATGRTPDLIAPFGLERFRRDHVLADQASAGTR
jgi:sarcosine oxidase subunit beta